MTGIPPFNDDTPQKVFDNILSRSKPIVNRTQLQFVNLPIKYLLPTQNHNSSLPPSLLCLDIEWPQGDEALSDGAVQAVELFLTMDPASRPTAREAQKMEFFSEIDWNNLQSLVPPFVPNPVDPTDTGYFEGKIYFFFKVKSI